jgi:hypothetical protein
MAPQIIGELEGTNCKIMNWHGFGIAVGPGRGPFILDDVENRRNKSKSNIWLMAGPPGEGKSYFALRLAEILDADFDVTVQVVFERTQLLKLIGNDSPLKRKQVIMIDEAQFLAGARSWYDTIQVDLMNQLEAVRSKGYIIIIVALHRNLLDLIIRQYVLTLMFWLENRGEATVYNVFTPRFESEAHQTRVDTLKLNLPDVEKCAYPDCLTCKYLYAGCMTNRATYERIKREMIGRFAKNAQTKAEIKQMAEKRITKDKMIEVLLANKAEIVYTSHGKPDIVSIKAIVSRELKKELSTDMAYEVARLFSMRNK